MVLKLRGILLRFTNYESTIEVDAPTVRAALTELTERYPEMRDVLFDRSGAVRPTHLVALNGEALTPEELDRASGDDDRVDIVTAVSGG
jgi:molybdopterin synthase sulfur carrier subunit